MRELTDQIRIAIDKLYKKNIIDKNPEIEIQITRTKDKKFGDFSTNAAFILANKLRINPKEFAKIIVEELEGIPSIEKTEVAGSGYINFFIKKSYLFNVVKEVLDKIDEYGKSDKYANEYILLEFVSANPVGPLHLGHGRWAVIGDTLANLLKAMGSKVEKEFYINDFGNQMKVFGESVAVRYKELFGQNVKFPENGYKGEYIKEIAKEIAEKDGDVHLNLPKNKEIDIFTDKAYEQVIAHLKKSLKDFGLVFDKWFSERNLHKQNQIQKTIDKLRKNGCVYDNDGAVWLNTTKYGDDKDRVLIKGDKQPTYFAADIAYHADKINRGYTKMINIWGADHHGYVARIKASVKALGADNDLVEIIIGQLVNLVRQGKPVKMSKRTGEMVTFEELIDEVGKDAARFFFLSRHTDTPLDFDIELAKKQSSENPVYYVQYAHARICSILRTAMERGIDLKSVKNVDFSLLINECEVNLASIISEFPEVIEKAAVERAPNKLTTYAQKLAEAFHIFYTNCRIVDVEENLRSARAHLLLAVQIVLKNTLDLMGINAPQKM